MNDNESSFFFVTCEGIGSQKVVKTMQMSNGTCYESQTELYIEYYLIEMVVWGRGSSGGGINASRKA